VGKIANVGYVAIRFQTLLEKHAVWWTL